MRLSLDHAQRLNLHVMIGLRPASVGLLRAAWALQAKLEPNEAESEALDLKRPEAGGFMWNTAKSLPPVEFEFSPAEVMLLRDALTNGSARPCDRAWLEPLIVALLEPTP